MVILCNWAPNALANSWNCSRSRLSEIFFIVWMRIKAVLLLVGAACRRAVAFWARMGNGANVVVVDGTSTFAVNLSVLGVSIWAFVGGINVVVVVGNFLSPYQVVRGYRSDNIRINDDNAVDSCIGGIVDSTETWLIFLLNHCSLLMDDGLGSVSRLSDRNSLAKHGVNNSKLNITTKFTLCFGLTIIWQANGVDSPTDENNSGKIFIREEATTRGWPQETLITRFCLYSFASPNTYFNFSPCVL